MALHRNMQVVCRLCQAFHARDGATLAASIADHAVWHDPGSTRI